MSTDSFIKEKYGKHQPFRVPADYFEGLSSQIMAHTDNRQPLKTPGLWGKYKKALLLAACLCAFAVSTAIYVHSAYDADEAVAKGNLPGMSDDHSMESIADYTMLDNEDIYALVSNY